MGNGTLPAKNTLTCDNPNSTTQNTGMPIASGETRKPVIIAGEGVAQQKPTEGMPSFGNMRPGISFKNIVEQNPIPKKTDTQSNVASDVVSLTGTSLKFGSFNASLPPRVQSAPPQLEEEAVKIKETVLETTPEEGQPQFNGHHPPPSSQISSSAETSKLFVAEVRPFYPGRAMPYYGQNMNYVPYPEVTNNYYNPGRPPYAPGSYAPYHPQGYFVPSHQRPYAPYPSMVPYGSGSPAISTTSSKSQTGSIHSSFASVQPKQAKKITITHPDTMQEVKFDNIPKVPSKPAEPTPVKIEKPESTIFPASPKKTIPITLVNPENNQPVDLANFISSSSDQQQQQQQHSQQRPKVQDLINDSDDDDVFDEGFSSDDLLSDEDTEADANISNVQFPVILTRKIRVSYPEGSIPFTFPSEDMPLVYSNDFLLQFVQVCKGAAQDIASIAFPSDLPIDRSTRRSTRGNARHHRSSTAKSYTTEQVTLTNRAEDAWKRAGAMIMDEDMAILRDVKVILNKLTEDKFELLTNQILSMGVSSSAIMTGVIDMLFDKAVEEPRYAPLYAQFCSRIVKDEVDKKLATLPKEEHEDASKVSYFRKGLVTKCQIEYQNKRAYSKQRLERLLSQKVQNEEIEIQQADQESEQSNLISGELTEEDYALIKLKRRVLGNMRFIGELYLAHLIPEKIMHRVIQELLGEIVSPEEEEVESACRLIPTIGAYLDNQESAPMWAKYVERLRALSVNPKLPTRVRFMVLDVLELRERGWKKNTSVTPSQSTTSKGKNERDSRRDSRSGATVKYSTTNARNQDVRYERQGGKTERQAPRVISSRQSSEEVMLRPVSTSSRGSQESLNRYHALEDHQEATSPFHNPEEETTTGADNATDVENVAIDQKLLSKILGTFDEAVKQKNYEDVTLAITEAPANSRSVALTFLISFAMEKGRRHVETLVAVIIPEFCKERLLSNEQVTMGLKNSFDTLDDLVVDVPSAIEFAGIISAAFIDSNSIDLKTLVGEVLGDLNNRASLIVAKLLVFLLASSKMSFESKKQLVDESKSCLTDNILNPLHESSVKALSTKLEIDNLIN